jgi:hypothetical protein
LAIWTLPGERTKNGAAHTVPLSAPARDLLRALLPDDERGKQDAQQVDARISRAQSHNVTMFG